MPLSAFIFQNIINVYKHSALVSTGLIMTKQDKVSIVRLLSDSLMNEVKNGLHFVFIQTTFGVLIKTANFTIFVLCS